MPFVPPQFPDLAALNAEFAELQAGFIQRLPERQSRISQGLAVLLAEGSKSDQAALQLLHREVHNLVGAAGSYQLHELSQSARQLERLLWQLLKDAPVETSPDIRQALQQLMDVLFTQMQNPSSACLAKR